MNGRSLWELSRWRESLGKATSGIEPKLVMMAPVEAIKKLLKKTGWSLSDVDLIELNEAFAVQAVAITRELDLDPEKLNVNGGAVALGHAIGQSGSRILTTMLYEMKRRDAHRGIAALCLGGGNAVAMAVPAKRRGVCCRANASRDSGERLHIPDLRFGEPGSPSWIGPSNEADRCPWEDGFCGPISWNGVNQQRSPELVLIRRPAKPHRRQTGDKLNDPGGAQQDAQHALSYLWSDPRSDAAGLLGLVLIFKFASVAGELISATWMIVGAIVFVVLLFAVGRCQWLSGSDLLSERQWVKPLSIAVAIISLVNIPIRIALGIYTDQVFPY